MGRGEVGRGEMGINHRMDRPIKENKSWHLQSIIEWTVPSKKTRAGTFNQSSNRPSHQRKQELAPSINHGRAGGRAGRRASERASDRVVERVSG